MNCTLCDDGAANPAAVQVDCITDDGEATVFCCIEHIIDGYAAAVVLSENQPRVTILDASQLGNIRCPVCGSLMTPTHQH